MNRFSAGAPALLFALIVAGLVLAPAGCSSRPRSGAEALTAEQCRLNEESFDQVWTTIRDKHWDPALGGLDWEAVRAELRPRASGAATMEQARAAMEEMLARLGQSHFQIYPAHLYDDVSGTASEGDGTAGLHLRVVEGAILVVAIDPDSRARGLGVRPGWAIQQVRDEDPRPRIAELAQQLEGKTYRDVVLARSAERHLTGTIGETVPVLFVDEEGAEQTLDLPLLAPRGRKVSLGNLPPNWVWFESGRVDEEIGYLAFNFFLDPGPMMKQFGDEMGRLADAPGVILDLRGNLGGIGAMAMGMAGWMVNTKGQKLGTMRTRESELNFAVTPRAGAYEGPVAVLVDGLSASTAEILAGGLQDLGRARIFGTPTAGAALPSNIERLPNGDGFQYAVASYTSQGGKPLEGLGVQPDELVVPTRAALLAEGDPILQAAVAWIRDQK